MEKGGQEPIAAIVSATSLAAESLGLPGQTGSIAPDLEADLIAVWVMKAGRVVRNDVRC